MSQGRLERNDVSRKSRAIESHRPLRLRKWLVSSAFLLAVSPALNAQKFYPDDPLLVEPKSLRVEDARSRKINDIYDLFLHSLGDPGELQPKHGEPIRALSTNTLDEVPDSAWFTNRIGSRKIETDELVRGPGNDRPPAEGRWWIVGAKTEGITPGFLIEDSTRERYFLKFDPATNPEMTTAADVIGSIFFHALGYNVAQNYLVYFHPDRLEIAPGVTVADNVGRRRPISRMDVDVALGTVPTGEDGRIRAIASRLIPGKILGGFRYFGTRSDDYNDTVPHEHRRELRGLFVFCAWLNHSDSRSINTLDSLVEDGDNQYVKHFLIDFGAILGSASVQSNTARDGNAYFYEFKPALAQITTLGLYVPRWARARYHKSRAVGMINWDAFDPEVWKPNYPNPAFQNRLPDDTFWAAKKVMAFSDEHIRAVVDRGEYSDPEDAGLVTRYLIERRNRIGAAYFDKVLPLDDFRVRERALEFQDLAVRYGLGPTREYEVRWFQFDNDSGKSESLAGVTGRSLPDEVRSGAVNSYWMAEISGAASAKKTTQVYLRMETDGLKVVGVERHW